MHRINPEKLLHSKWTAIHPVQRERHFIVTALLRDEQQVIQSVELEAVLTRRAAQIDWRQLRDSEIWLMGWR